MTTRHRVWDPAIRLFHWSLVAAFVANALFTDPERSTHRWVGYAVIGLLAFRVIWGLIGTRHARFADFPPSISASLGQIGDMAAGRRAVHVGHSPLGALMIYNLLAALIGIAATGYMMTTLTWFGVEWVEEAHELLVTWAEVSVVAHVLAVVVESRRLRVNLPKAMVTGYKDIADGAAVD
jgi:cytochrome b